jgi:hypothetical protein
MEELYKQMEPKREEWIDLDILITSCHYSSKNLLVPYWQYNDDCPSPSDNNIHYLLRQALRAVGHKIGFNIVSYNRNGKIAQMEFYTSVTRAEYEIAQMFRKEYSDAHEDEQHEGYDSHSESIPESAPQMMDDPVAPG